MNAAAEPIEPARHNLPIRMTPLIGREFEMAEVGALLTSERIVTLTGSGGCGKSRLANEVAIRLTDRFPGGIAWIDLTSCSDLDSLVALVAGVVDVIELSGERLLTRLVGALRARPPIMIVLDNAEHVLDAVAEAVVALCSGVPQVTVMITSREPVGVPGELVWRVPSLSAPRADELATLDLAAMQRFDAVRLFADRGARTRRGFHVTAANAAAIGQICARLDGVPLAIELAAALVRTMPPERIAAQLDDRFRLLAGGPRTLVARQQTLQASVEWSEGLLSDDERLVFRRLAVFVGGFTVEAAEAVVGAFADVDEYDLCEIISRLVDKSLVQLDDEHDRYSMMETIRSYALQRLYDTGETAPARDAHAAWCADWLGVACAEDDAVDPNSWWESRLESVDRIGVEWPNCASALDWLDPSNVTALRIVAGLGDYWAIRQRASDSARYGMPPLLAADHTVAEWLVAMMRLMAVRTNAMDPQFGLLREDAIRLATERNDTRALLRLEISRLITMVMLLGPRDDLLEAISNVKSDALAAHEWNAAWNGMQSPAVILTATGRLRDAENLIDGLTRARALLIRATIAQLRGEFETSAELADAASRFVDSRSGATLDRMLVAFRAAGAGLAMADRGLLEIVHSPEVSIDTLPPFFTSTYAIVCGVEDLLDGNLEAARQQFADVQIDLFTSWLCVGYLAQIELSLGNVEAARAAAVRLAAASAEVSAPLYEAISDLVLAECGQADDLAAALDTAHRALATSADAELWLIGIDALEVIGCMLATVGRTRDAARTLAAADAARNRMGYRYRFPHRAAAVSTAVDAVRGDDGWAEGSGLSLADAIGVAQRMRGERVRPVSGWASLTPTELAVAEQVAAGLTNPQIAEKLVMSRATVKTHLVHVYAKLAISNRAELAVAVHRRSAQ